MGTAAVGYSGGSLENPTYKDVCTDETGHAEVVEVDYDPAKVRYEQLLDVFWNEHDPTTLNRQGPDHGSQYRSAVFYHDDEQKAAATASKEGLQASGRFRRPIVTEISPAATFYRAEEYHQQYLVSAGRLALLDPLRPAIDTFVFSDPRSRAVLPSPLPGARREPRPGPSTAGLVRRSQGTAAPKVPRVT